jgi:hypothetical protein
LCWIKLVLKVDFTNGETGSSKPEVKTSIVGGKGAQVFVAAVVAMAMAKDKRMRKTFILMDRKLDCF